MKLATFNVNSIKMRAGIVRDWLETHRPDILALQELKGTDFPEPDFKSLGYTSHVVAQKAYNGVAILTRDETVTVDSQPPVLTRLPGMEDDDQARCVVLRIVAPIAMTVINVYVPNGNPVGTDKYAYKLRWLKALCDDMGARRARGENVVVMGDYNIIPEDADSARPEDWRGDALAQPEVRAMYRAMVYAGYIDTLKTYGAGAGDGRPTDQGNYTFWDYQAGAWQRNNGIRIDHILVTPGLADRVQRVWVDRTPRGAEKPSDHTPVGIEIATEGI